MSEKVLRWRIETMARNNHAGDVQKEAEQLVDKCNGVVDEEPRTNLGATLHRELFAAAKKVLPRTQQAFRFLCKVDGEPHSTAE